MKRMEDYKVLLISIPPGTNKEDAKGAFYVFPPMGLLVLADRLYDKVKKVDILDFNLYQELRVCNDKEREIIIKKQLCEKAEGNLPDVIGVSIMFSSSYDFFSVLVKIIHEILPNCVILCGGIHATNTADFMLKANPEIDYVICGEGEEAFIELLKNISNKSRKNIKGIHDIKNIKYINNGKLETANPVDKIDVDLKKYEKAIDLNLYIDNTSLFSLSQTKIDVKAFSVMASRGCPVSCIFCAAHTVHGKKPRWRDINNIKDEVMLLVNNYGVNKIYLMDDNFIPKSKAIELFNLFSSIRKSLGNTEFEIVIQNMSVNHTDFDIIDAIIDAGIKYIPLAIETGSSVMQKKIKKYCDLNKAIELVSYAQRKGVEVRCFYIIGFPGETVAQMQETIDFAGKVQANWSSFNVAVPLPGSEMYDEFIAMGYIDHSPSSWSTGTIRNRVFNTPEINAPDIMRMAYSANLKINFIDNIDIINKRYEEAKIIFMNFTKTFDFHIFAYDALRRISKLQGDKDLEKEYLEKMCDLVNTDNRAMELLDYSYLLDDDVQRLLSPPPPPPRYTHEIVICNLSDSQLQAA